MKDCGFPRCEKYQISIYLFYAWWKINPPIKWYGSPVHVTGYLNLLTFFGYQIIFLFILMIIIFTKIPVLTSCKGQTNHFYRLHWTLYKKIVQLNVDVSCGYERSGLCRNKIHNPHHGYVFFYPYITIIRITRIPKKVFYCWC